MIDKLDTCMLF